MHSRLINRILAATISIVCLGVSVTAQAQPTVIRMLVQSSPLAGFAHYEADKHFASIKEGDELRLIREPDNPHDVNAVRVEWRGVKLGYLPRRENRAIALEMDRGGRIEARVARLRQHPNPRERLLIDIFAVL